MAHQDLPQEDILQEVEVDQQMHLERKELVEQAAAEQQITLELELMELLILAVDLVEVHLQEAAQV